MVKKENLPGSLMKIGIEEKLSKICEKNDVGSLSIFGSYARGEQTKKSDIDLAVKFRKNSRKTLFDLIQMQFELGKVFKKRIDLGTVNSLNRHVLGYIKRDLKVIYEKR